MCLSARPHELLQEHSFLPENSPGIPVNWWGVQTSSGGRRSRIMPLQTNFSEHKFFARTRALTVAVPGRRRDWFRILRDLMTVGISMSAVGRLCNRDVGTVRAWAQGGEPKESDARLVLALYSQHCPDQYRKSQSVLGIQGK